MPQTPDRSPGESDDEGIILEDAGVGNDPPATGEIRYVDGSFRLHDDVGVFNPRQGADAIANEELLELDPNAMDITYVVTRGSTGLVTSESWIQTANGREVKRIAYTYSGRLIASETRTIYSLADGTTVVSSKTITYSWTASTITGWSAGAGADTFFTSEPLLEIDPSMVGITYALTTTDGLITRETWTQTVGGLEVKRNEYSYTGRRVAQEIRKVFSLADGITVVAQKTVSYAFNAALVIGAAVTRDV